MSIGAIAMGVASTHAKNLIPKDPKGSFGKTHAGFAPEHESSLLPSAKPASAAQEVKAVAPAPPKPVTSGSSNVMAGNFAEAGKGPSRYRQASIKSAQGQKALANQMDRQMGALMLIYTAIRPDTPPGKVEALVKRLASDPHVAEEMAKNLEEIRERLEEKAEEAMAPKDENGNPIETSVVDPQLEQNPVGVDAAPVDIGPEAPPVPDFSPTTQTVDELPPAPSLPADYKPIDIIV